MTHLLHFSIGPVQGFIGEARRTRDLWAGSFLLSWLSAQAMLAVEKAVAAAGGDPLQAIVFPTVVNDDLMEAVRGCAKAPWGGEGRSLVASPHIGSVPNRFKASVADSKMAKTAAEAAIEAVQDRWQALADEVWKAFVAPAAGEDVADRRRVETNLESPDRQLLGHQLGQRRAPVGRSKAAH